MLLPRKLPDSEITLLHVLKFVTSGLIPYKSWHSECVYIVQKSYAERHWPRKQFLMKVKNSTNQYAKQS